MMQSKIGVLVAVFALGPLSLPATAVYGVETASADAAHSKAPAMPETEPQSVFQRVAEHEFHPLDEDGAFTVDRRLREHGIADLDDRDWRVRLLAVRDLVRIGAKDRRSLEAGLEHDDAQVRYVSAAALGILGEAAAAPALSRIAKSDPSPLARSQAVIALGQITAESAVSLLKEIEADDPIKDVRHQAELSLDQIGKGMGVTPDFRRAWLELDPANFETVATGDRAPDFTLPDTEDRDWRLSDHLGEGWIALIWVFADWCPVCHGEFDELIELRDAFEAAGIQPVTLEAHDRYRARVMVGKEIEPDYWFAEASFQERYTKKIWWPHLRDPAGAVGARFGIDPMAFAVHSEYINRPSVVILDPEGTVRFAYRGTYWGDRPSIRETLEMIQTENFEYQHPDRLRPEQKSGR